MDDYQMMVDAYKEAGGEDVFSDSDVAHVVLERDKVLGTHTVEGLEVNVKKQKAGMVSVKVTVLSGYKIEKPVHMCFGVLPEEGRQMIDMDISVEEDAEVEVMADCVFPNATKVKHEMEANVLVENGGRYIYRENHYHGDDGGVEVIANSEINLKKDSTFKTYFNLRKGRVGKIEFDYESVVGENATLEMVARMQGYDDDEIKIREAGDLIGPGARGLLETKIALQDEAQGEVLNEMTATAPGAKGHVDCTEIIKDDARARAVPIVDVGHPEAKVTHEAAIGSVDSTQLQTLMARGLDEEEASEVIIQGMLNS
ncbi:MAG: SufB/SufD family protein [Halanaerobiales bacterium]